MTLDNPVVLTATQTDTCTNTWMDYAVKTGRADAGMNPFPLLPPSSCF